MKRKRYEATPAPATVSLFSPIVNAGIASLLLIAVAAGVMLVADWFDWRLLVVVGMVPLLIVGLGSLGVAMRRLMWEAELFTGLDLDQDGMIGEPVQPERIRVVPVRGGQLIDDVEHDDLVFFIRTICEVGDWTQRGWTGTQMPSGRVCDTLYHQSMCQVLKKAGILQGHGPRTSGHLVTRDAHAILSTLRLR